MRNNLLLAAGTGLLSAILLMIAASGSLTITLLAYLTPLPLLILGLSGKSYFGGVAGALAALILFLVTTPLVAIIYFFLVDSVKMNSIYVRYLRGSFLPFSLPLVVQLFH